MIIAGYEPHTLVDYPGHLASIIFLAGCNFRCPYCHNSHVIEFRGTPISREEVFSHLNKRRTILEGVVITGGEPLAVPEVFSLARDIKALGLKVKLDTNGSFPSALEEFISCGLADYIAMDIKHAPEKYPEACGISPDMEAILRSVSIIKSLDIPYEFRTTLCAGIHSPGDMHSIGQIISGASKYCLQAYRPSDTVLLPGEYELSPEEIHEFSDIASKYIQKVEIRA